MLAETVLMTSNHFVKKYVCFIPELVNCRHY